MTPLVCSFCGKGMKTDRAMWTGFIAVIACDHVRNEGEQVGVSEAPHGTSRGPVDGRDSDVSSMPPVGQVPPADPKCVVCDGVEDHPCHRQMPEFGSIWSHHPFAELD